MGKTVFVLEVIDIEKHRRKYRDDYPNFTTRRREFSYYRSLSSAEQGLKDYLKQKNTDALLTTEELYCFYIHEIPYGHFLFSNLANYASRVYDSFGNKLDERLYPTSDFDCRFSGRPLKKQRFKKGDVIEYHGELMIVAECPTVANSNISPYCDDSDDCYLALYLEQDFDGDKGYVFHNHPSCLDAFLPRFPIPEKVQAQIERVKKWHFTNDMSIE